MDAATETFIKERALIDAMVQTNVQKWHEFGGFSSVQWWMLLAFLILPWFVWIKLAARRRTLDTMLMGTLVMILTLLLDMVGYFLHFWDYPLEIMPLVPGAWPFDLSLVPVAYMLLYDNLRSWRSYSVGLLVMTVVYAFIGEPFAIWMGLIFYIKWSHVYSVIFYILTGVFARALVVKLKSMSQPIKRYNPAS